MPRKRLTWLIIALIFKVLLPSLLIKPYKYLDIVFKRDCPAVPFSWMSWKWAMYWICMYLMWAWTDFLLVIQAGLVCSHSSLFMCCLLSLSTCPLRYFQSWWSDLTLPFSLAVFGLPPPHRCNPPRAWKWWYTSTLVFTLMVSNPALSSNCRLALTSWFLNENTCSVVSVCPKLWAAQLWSMQPNHCYIDIPAFISQCSWFQH